MRHAPLAPRRDRMLPSLGCVGMKLAAGRRAGGSRWWMASLAPLTGWCAGDDADRTAPDALFAAAERAAALTDSLHLR